MTTYYAFDQIPIDPLKTNVNETHY